MHHALLFFAYAPGAVGEGSPLAGCDGFLFEGLFSEQLKSVQLIAGRPFGGSENE